MTKDFEARALEKMEEWIDENVHSRWDVFLATKEAFMDGARYGRTEGLDEAAGIAIEQGKSVKGGYNNAAHEIAEAIHAAKEKKT